MNNNDIYTYIPKDNLGLYFLCMERCVQVSEQTKYHPEANVLIHLLQVTEIAFRESEDLDLILAAMLHDIGKFYGKDNHVIAALEILEGHISKKTEFLINNHMRIHYLLDGEIRKLSKIYKLIHSPWLSDLVLLDVLKINFKTEPMINIAHNYAVLENHFNQNIMIHRKGATRAREGEIGIIPGSQGTNSYIVEGLGNPESFMSCSHGAGRKMGRKQAIRELSLEDEQAKLDKQEILHSVRGKKSLDEAPGAYKDIAEVMDNQKDLVRIVTELKPLAVVKG